MLDGQNIPAGAIVRLSVGPTEEGAYLVANTIVLNDGANISISARGAAIPGAKITERRGAEVGKENTGIGSYFGQSVVLAAGGDADEAIQGGSAVGVVAGVVGLASPSTRKVVRLVRGTYFLDIDSE